jgi:peroxiredoxin
MRNFEMTLKKIDTVKNVKLLLFILTALVSLPGFAQAPKDINSLFGNWRAVFHVKDSLDIPFIFEITGTDAQNANIYFINGAEHFYGGKLSFQGDSIFFPIDQFDNLLAFKKDGNNLSGFLKRQDKTGTPLALTAEKGDLPRFKESLTKPEADISGAYDITFKNEKGADEKAVGLFKQNGNKLKATFLRITGDSRYLDGIVSGDSFYLSTFIGSGPGYYTGTFSKDGNLTGNILYARGSQKFTGSHNEEAALPDSYSLTYLKNGYSSLDFTFPDIYGKPVSLKEEKYKNKVVIVTITGSWCPNCIDEAAFLAPWFKKNQKRGVEIIAIQYERKTDTAFARKVISRFKKRYGVEYDQVFAGLADKQFVAESLPALNTFLSFPTTIFIDRNGKVNKIHTGFTGPATGKYYDQFIKEFNDEVDMLVKQ